MIQLKPFTCRPATTFILYLLCAVVFTIQGCAPTLTWVKDENEGASAIYPMPFKVVWDTIPVTFKELGLVKVDEDKNKKFFLAQGKMSLLSHGEKVSVFVEKVDETNTKVKVISKRTLRSDTAANNWEEPILDKLNELLGTSRLDN
jgi:hypothetical protein